MPCDAPVTRAWAILWVVIPTILFPSFIIGRWWIIPLAAVAWTALLLASGTIGASGIPAAAAFAAVNAAVGVGAHQAVLVLFRSSRAVVRVVRRRTPSTPA
jgi:hypothetical protein